MYYLMGRELLLLDLCCSFFVGLSLKHTHLLRNYLSSTTSRRNLPDFETLNPPWGFCSNNAIMAVPVWEVKGKTALMAHWLHNTPHLSLDLLWVEVTIISWGSVDFNKCKCVCAFHCSQVGGHRKSQFSSRTWWKSFNMSRSVQTEGLRVAKSWLSLFKLVFLGKNHAEHQKETNNA